uniref:Receptor expression-enhancing protein n=1 Tax=Syphacia muris TaxID=451379 RepID=A0A0N5AEQ1_9BILA
MLLNFLTDTLSMLFGALYPAFQSYCAIRNKDEQNILKWSKYWVVFALYLVSTAVGELLLVHYLLPGYVLIKLTILCYISNPWTNGSELAFDKFAAPFFDSHGSDLDSLFKNASIYLHDMFLQALGNCLERYGGPLLAFSDICSFWKKQNPSVNSLEYQQFNTPQETVSTTSRRLEREVEQQVPTTSTSPIEEIVDRQPSSENSEETRQSEDVRSRRRQRTEKVDGTVKAKSKSRVRRSLSRRTRVKK